MTAVIVTWSMCCRTLLYCYKYYTVCRYSSQLSSCGQITFDFFHSVRKRLQCMLRVSAFISKY